MNRITTCRICAVSTGSRSEGAIPKSFSFKKFASKSLGSMSSVPYRLLPSGIALVETVVLITLTAILSGLMVTGMAALLRINHSLTHHQVGQTALQQMATMLRMDIHRATSCHWDQESQTLLMHMPKQSTIKYLPRKQRWIRILTADSEPPVTTSYRVDDSFRGESRGRRVDQGGLIHFVLKNCPLQQTPEKSSTERTLQSEIVAVVGRDYAWLDE